MNSEIFKQVEAIIKAGAAEGVFTSEVIRQMHDIQTKAQQMESDLASIKEELRTTRAELDKANDSLHESRAKVKSMESYMAEATELKKQFEVLKLKEEYGNKRVQDHIHMVELIFRSPVMKRTFDGTFPAGIDEYGNPRGGYGSARVEESIA